MAVYDSRKIGKGLFMRHKRDHISRITFPMLLVLIILLTACGSSARTESGQGEETGTESETIYDTAPHTKPDGGKYRLAYIDYDEYMPASRPLYYILRGLEETGWIREGTLPFDIEEINARNLSTKEIYRELERTDLGEYLEFADNAFFYLGYDNKEEIANTLKSRAGNDIDLVITFGTGAGVFVKELGLPIPMTDFSATDPVASGIIDSADGDSGNPNVWAQVEPSLPLRQLKYYHSICPFERLGIIVYADETVSGVPDIVRSGEENNFQIVKYNIPEQSRETEQEQEEYYALVERELRSMAEEGIDAFFLTVDLINDIDRMKGLLSILYDKNIPVYLMDDVMAVKSGALMLISANDLENVGRFVADAIGKILNGAVAGQLPCRYTSAPSIYLNYDVAKQIGYPLRFEFLAACDEIYTESVQ